MLYNFPSLNASKALYFKTPKARLYLRFTSRRSALKPFAAGSFVKPNSRPSRGSNAGGAGPLKVRRRRRGRSGTDVSDEDEGVAADVEGLCPLGLAGETATGKTPFRGVRAPETRRRRQRGLLGIPTSARLLGNSYPPRSHCRHHNPCRHPLLPPETHPLLRPTAWCETSSNAMDTSTT